MPSRASSVGNRTWWLCTSRSLASHRTSSDKQARSLFCDTYEPNARNRMITVSIFRDSYCKAANVRLYDSSTFIRHAGIALMLNVKHRIIEYLARCTEARVLEAIEELNIQPRLGTCELFYLQRFELPDGRSKTLAAFSGCRPHLGCTMVLRGHDDYNELLKLKHIVRFVCYVAHSLRCVGSREKEGRRWVEEEGKTVRSEESSFSRPRWCYEWEWGKACPGPTPREPLPLTRWCYEWYGVGKRRGKGATPVQCLATLFLPRWHCEGERGGGGGNRFNAW